MLLRLLAPARPVAYTAFLIVVFSSRAALGSALPPPPDSSLAALHTALREAWARHPAADATEYALAAARARSEASSRPLYNPELELGIDDEGLEQTVTAGMALTLDLSGKRRALTDAGRADLSLAEAEASLRRSAFVQQWLQGWAELSIARDRVHIGEQRLALMQRFADLAERQFTVGDISSLERDLALLARDEAQAEQATLLAEAASAEESYRVVGGSPARAADIVTIAPPGAWIEDPTWQTNAAPEGRLAAASTARTATRIVLAERARRPDPTVRLYGGRKDLGPVSDDVFGVSVTVPLFVRNRYSAELAAARADGSAATAEQRRVELELSARADRTVNVYTAVREAWIRWSQSAGTDVTVRAGLLERLWRAGEISTSDHMIQLRQSLDTLLAGADLRGRLWRSYIDALYATGRLDAWVGFDNSVSEVAP